MHLRKLRGLRKSLGGGGGTCVLTLARLLLEHGPSAPLGSTYMKQTAVTAMCVRKLKPLLWLVLIVATARPLQAQIPVTGLSDRTMYNDQVTFTISAEAGYSYAARLDGTSVPVGQPLTVQRVDYHELAVVRTNTASGAVTNQLTRFIVAASERNGSENGLPPWIPFPMIPSTAEEVAGAHLQLIVPEAYPIGMEIPIVAWVINDGGGPVRANGSLAAVGQPSIILRRGVGSGFLPAQSTPGPLSYTPCFIAIATNKTVVIETNTTWTSVSGTLASVTWPENSRILVTANLTIPAGTTIMVGAGSVIKLMPGVSVIVSGSLQVNGLVDRPVVFGPGTRNQPWGGFYLTNSASQLNATATIFTGSGADPNAVPNSHRHEQCLFYLDNHAHLSLSDCAAMYLAGQFGHAVDEGQPWNDIVVRRSLIQRCTTGGEWNGSSIQFLQSALIETPYETGVFSDGDEDGIYFTTGQYIVRDSLIGWTRDDGIDSGSGGTGSVTVSNSWIESTFHEAFAWSGGGRVTTNAHTVCLNCGQGIECGWSSTANSPNDFVTDSLSLANLVGARFGDNYDWTYTGFLRVTNSLLLNNYRDIWGMNWQDWTYRASAMDLRSNFVTAANSWHPNNLLWDPVRDGWRLAAFMTTPPEAKVGLGLAVRQTQFTLRNMSNAVPVRLSSFTTNTVSVDYTFETSVQSLSTGSIEFLPGETLKYIPGIVAPTGESLIRLRLHDPVRSEVTGIGAAWFVESLLATNNTLIATGAVWKYLNTGVNAGTAWRELGFDDSAWPSGKAELGYGDAKDGRPEATVIGYGGVDTNKFITYYFRRSFVLTNPPVFGGLTVQLKRDDGGIVYLNGTNIFSSNMPQGPVNYLTRANLASDDGTVFYSTNAPASLLRQGTNTVAVEIHQESVTSSDISFDLALEASPALVLRLVRFGADWLLTWDDLAAGLEEAEELGGPWSAQEGTSPVLVDQGLWLKFYRLHKP